MQGCKQLEPRLFYQLSLEQLVPAEHLVRRLASVLDFSWVRSATAQQYSHTGKPSIDPVVVAKLLVLGFLYNVNSERQLMRDVQVNLAYRWYLGYDLDESVPHHSILSKARRRLGVAFFEQLFGWILECSRQAGLVRGDNVLLDSTLVEANASLDSITALQYRPTEYWQQLEKTTAASCEPAPQDTDPHSGQDMGQKRPRRDRISQKKHSTTDPDATLVRRPGQKAKPAYKAHMAVDEQQGIVTAVVTTAAAVDDTAVVPELLAQHEAGCGRPERVVADHLYGSQDCLGYLQHRQIETVILPRQGGNGHGGWDKSVFRYDGQADVYHCPGGKQLRRYRTQKKDHKAFYRSNAKDCRRCPFRKECLSCEAAHAVRHVTRFDTPYVERAQAACATGRGRRLLRKRQTCIEGIFGQAKNFHGLRRARWRRRSQMHIQSLLTAIVLNVKQLLRASMGQRALCCQKTVLNEPKALFHRLWTLLLGPLNWTSP